MLDRNCDSLAQQLGADSVQVSGGVPKIPAREKALHAFLDAGWHGSSQVQMAQEHLNGQGSG